MTGLIAVKFKIIEMIKKVRSRKEYELVMKSINSYLEMATKRGGFHQLNQQEVSELNNLSELAEAYEDKTEKMMPLKPGTLREAIEYKRFEEKISQAKLAQMLELSPSKLSQILSGKRKPDVKFIKAVYERLGIDADFILSNI